MRRRLTIVQGPPGTGKSTVAVTILQKWAQMGIRPLLATAECNVAVDNIAEVPPIFFIVGECDPPTESL